MTAPAHATPQDFVPFATAALDFHRCLNIPGGPLVTSRAELDALHAHLISLHALLDAHTMRTHSLVEAEGGHLQATRTRLWQAADHLHAAYHAAPHPTSGELPDREACRNPLPEGAPELTICRRHQEAARLVRRRTTPADLHTPYTGLTNH
ncbi:hypothetical protein G3I76_65725 [Streptomyces sp. SID11233]|uniref:DUF6238 family protein n=1 Tax=Streptomyces sp. SID11385 TaxID=2706031 RepID=UPI0013C01863|nr:DUF6238 family protein [Streptomyces sp. SID11385]NEA37715.1 hypothetical protein [Streptomyces sp. SID11385]NEA43523.1 hypothetical protein [Streptomyces sp. SID11385]NED91270.1 hypothetical protein [Streptomyces sp. SID11233]